MIMRKWPESEAPRGPAVAGRDSLLRRSNASGCEGREPQGFLAKKDEALCAGINKLYFDCHSGLDPESSFSDLDSRRSLPRALTRGENDRFRI